MNRVIARLFSGLVLLGFSYCYGDLSGLQFENYNKENSGLPINNVYNVIEDKEGYIWASTEYGFKRFNGVEFEGLSEITGKDFGPKFDVVIKQVFFDSEDNLWLATVFDGIYKLDLKTLALEEYNEKHNDNYALTSGYVRKIISDKQNNIWIATARGMNKYNLSTGKMMRIPSRELFSDDRMIDYISYTPWENLLSIATTKGVYYFDVNTNAITNLYDSVFSALKDEVIHSVHYDGINNLWISSKNKLFYYDYTSKKLGEIKLSKEININRYLYSMDNDKSGVLWAGLGDEIFAIDMFQHSLLWSYRLNLSKKEINDIYNVYIGANGQLWLSTNLNGIWKANLRNHMFNAFTTKSANDNNHISHNEIQSVYEDYYGNPWISVRGYGVNHYDFDLKKWMFYPTSFFAGQDKVYQKSNIMDVVGDLEKNIFFSIREKIIKFNPVTRSATEYTYPENTVRNNKYHNGLSQMLYDSNSRLWSCAYPNYISYINTKTGKAEYIEPVKNVLDVDIFESTSNNIWLITDKGLLVFNESEKRFEKVTIEFDQQLNPAIYAIDELPAGILWLGTDYGLVKYDVKHKKSKIYTTHDGLSNSIVAGVLSDEQDSLWVSTFNGLNKFNYITEEFNRYYVEDGLLDNEFKVGTDHKSKNGRMYFAGSSGVVYFKPEDIKINNNPPKIDLAKLEISNKLIYSGTEENPLPTGKLISDIDHLELNYKQNEAKIQFNAIDYYAPKRIKYKYKINGYHDDWIETDYKDRAVRISNFDPGNYTLHIKAGNHHNVWNEEGRKLHITILPPPWKTWWAYTLYVLSILLSIYLFFLYRTRQLKQRALILQQEVNKQTQEIKQQKNLIEDLLEKKNEFFANISHELRTPITLILGPVTKLINDFKDNRINKPLTLVERNTQRLSLLVDQLLQLSRLYHLHEEDKRLQCISAVAETLAISFKPIAESKHINFQVNIEKNIWISAVANATETLIINLLSNAFKYTPEQGEIHLNLLLTNNNTVQLKVKDNGIGISKENLDHIFERFTRVTSESIGLTEGVGLGLALVKQLVDLHDGNITVQSEKSKGSEFVIELPVVEVVEGDSSEETLLQKETLKQLDHLGHFFSKQEKPLTGPGKKDKAFENTHQPRVLVIDDTPDMCTFMADLLSEYYQCTTVSNGADGIRTAVEQIPDLILCDVMMPEMDGFDVLKQLRDKIETSHIPILMVTAKGDKESRIKGLGLLANDYITKPFDNDELLARMTNILIFSQLRQKKIAQLLESKASDKDFLTVEIEAKDKTFLKQLKEIISERFSDPEFTIDELAGAFNFSSRKLQYKMNALIGQTPLEYLREYRLKQARQLLLEKGGVISDLAEAAGFASTEYFSRCFKAYYGQPPKAYRETMLKQKVNI